MRSTSLLLPATLCAAALTLAACGSTNTGTASSAPASSPSSVAHSGPVSVLSAGSLLDLMEKAVVPGFHTATGYTASNVSAGSSDLATDIKGKVNKGDVFISASPAVNATLEGAANGSWVSWYATFATSGLVLGYNPKSTFATDLTTMPWYDVITKPGFKLGFTPPASDPKGVLAVKALTDTAAAQKLPALMAISAKTSDQFPETSLLAELGSGQLDAGFFYAAEADSGGIPTVPLTGVSLAAAYTVTVLNNAPDPDAATAFVSYLLGPAGQADLGRYGFTVHSPVTTSGTVPTSLASVIP